MFAITKQQLAIRGRRRSRSARRRRCMVQAHRQRAIRSSSSRARTKAGQVSSRAASSPRQTDCKKTRDRPANAARKHSPSGTALAKRRLGGASSTFFQLERTVDPRPSSISNSVVRQRIRLSASRMKRRRSSAILLTLQLNKEENHETCSPFEMPAEDRNRMAKFYTKAIWLADADARPRDERMCSLPPPSPAKMAVRKNPGAINGGFLQKISRYAGAVSLNRHRRWDIRSNEESYRSRWQSP